MTHKLLVSLRYITYIYPLSQNKLSLFPNLIKSNLVDTDTEGIIESVLINGVPVLSGSCYLSQKDTFYYSEGKISRETKHDISIVN